MDMSSIVNQMLVLLFLLAVGFVSNKAGIIDAAGTKSLSRIVLTISQSSMILSSVMSVEPTLNAMELLGIVGSSCVMYVILFLFSFLVRWILHVPKNDRGTYQFMAIFGNVGFMGFPIIASALGKEAVFYASLCNIPFNILTYSLGIYLISGDDDFKFDLKTLLNVPMIATLASVVIFSLKLSVPQPLVDGLSLLGEMVVPAAMLVIGSSLGGISIKEVLGDWRVYAFAPFRLIAAPVLVWAVLGLFVKNPMILSVLTILAATPVAANSTMLCMEYNGNETLASKGVFITTILSVGTIPLVLSILL